MDFSLSGRQGEIQALGRAFAQREVAPRSRQMDEQGEMPVELVRRMGELGLLGGPLPEPYGAGWDAVAQALVYEELGRVDSAVRGFVTVHTSLVAQTVAAWGTEEQKDAHLPRLASGEWVGCYCLTEPEAGSDAASLRSSATLEGDEYALRGEKIWVTNGRLADLALVFATVDPAARHRGICAFLVETGAPGFRREPMPGRELGHRAAGHAWVRLEGCRVPRSALLGGEGEGFKVAMSALDHGRLGVAAGGVGLAQACLDACVAFARSRRQFGKRIGDFEMVQAAIADMAAEVQAARGLVYRAAWLQDQGQRATRESSIAKLYAAEVAVRAAGEAVLIHGGRGYSNEYPVERYYRDAKGLQIYEGTSHIQRVVIARDLIGREDEGSASDPG